MNQRIINLRCFAIFLIVLGHSIIIYDRTFELFHTEVLMPAFETLKHITSYIQLKLFFAISGYLLFYKINKLKDCNFWSVYNVFISDKFVRLLIPYFCVCFLWMDPIKIWLQVPEYTLSAGLLVKQLGFMECGHLWFLACLFLMFAVSFPFIFLMRKTMTGNILAFVVLLGLWYVLPLPSAFQLDNVKYYLPFFYLGYLINYVQNTPPGSMLSRLLQHWAITTKTKIGKRLFVCVCALLMSLVLLLMGMVLHYYTSIGFDIYLSVVLVVLFFLFFPEGKSCVIDEISCYSYGIYLFHSPLIYITAFKFPNINPWLMLFVNFIVFGGIAYFISKSISNSRYRFILGLK